MTYSYFYFLAEPFLVVMSECGPVALKKIMRLNPGWQVTYIYLLFYVRGVLQKRMVKLMTWSFAVTKLTNHYVDIYNKGRM